MGFFRAKEELNLFEPGTMEILPYVANAIPDVGEAFLARIGSYLPTDLQSEIKQQIDSRRNENGWFRGDSFAGWKPRDYPKGPLTIMDTMMASDKLILEVWASLGLKGSDERTVRATVNTVYQEQGHAAAATWAILARPNHRFYIESLSDQLTESWAEWIGKLRQADLIKSVKKWRR